MRFWFSDQDSCNLVIRRGILNFFLLLSVVFSYVGSYAVPARPPVAGYYRLNQDTAKRTENRFPFTCWVSNNLTSPSGVSGTSSWPSASAFKIKTITSARAPKNIENPSHDAQDGQGFWVFWLWLLSISRWYGSPVYIFHPHLSAALTPAVGAGGKTNSTYRKPPRHTASNLHTQVNFCPLVGLGQGDSKT